MRAVLLRSVAGARNIRAVLRKAHAEFLRWVKQNKLQCSQPRFTPARLSRRYRVIYPCLASKAAQSKMLSFWLATVAGEFAARAHATPTDKAVSACIYAYVDTLRKMDEYPLLLSEEQSVELYNSGMRHLRLYSYLHRESAKRTGTEAMRNCWLLQPKHHFFYHMCRDCKEQRLNPSYYSLLAAESWIGYIGPKQPEQPADPTTGTAASSGRANPDGRSADLQQLQLPVAQNNQTRPLGKRSQRQAAASRMHSSSMNRRSLPVVLFIEVTAGKVRNVQPPESDPNNGLHTPTVAARVTEPQRTPTMAEAVDATADRTPSSRAKDNPKVKDQPRLHKDLAHNFKHFFHKQAHNFRQHFFHKHAHSFKHFFHEHAHNFKQHFFHKHARIFQQHIFHKHAHNFTQHFFHKHISKDHQRFQKLEDWYNLELHREFPFLLEGSLAGEGEEVQSASLAVLLSLGFCCSLGACCCAWVRQRLKPSKVADADEDFCQVLPSDNAGESATCQKARKEHYVGTPGTT
eukprot:s186_g8.t2